MLDTADRVAETLILAPEFDAEAHLRLTASVQDIGAQRARRWGSISALQNYFFAEYQLGEYSVVVAQNKPRLGLSTTTDTDAIATIKQAWGSCD